MADGLARKASPPPIRAGPTQTRRRSLAAERRHVAVAGDPLPAGRRRRCPPHGAPVAPPLAPAGVEGREVTAAGAMPTERLGELLGLLSQADSVELKLTVPEADQRPTIAALGIDPIEAQIRQVYFFDTPDLVLNEAGVVVRARRVQAKGEDTVVKLRPVVPSELPKRVRRSPGFVTEVDAVPGGFVCSGTMKGMLAPGRVSDALAGSRPLRKLFSKEQRAFFADHAPNGLALDDLATLGPIFVLKARFRPPELGRKVVAEVWLYPDDSRVLELSTKCAPAEAFEVAAEARAYLHDRGVEIAAGQETKTKRALEFFAGGPRRSVRSRRN
jgi:hypothetical protein